MIAILTKRIDGSLGKKIGRPTDEGDSGIAAIQAEPAPHPDLHQRDPLAGMEVTTEGIGKLTSRLIAAADQLCDGRVVFVTGAGLLPLD